MNQLRDSLRLALTAAFFFLICGVCKGEGSKTIAENDTVDEVIAYDMVDCPQGNQPFSVIGFIKGIDWPRETTTLAIRVALKVGIDASLKHYVNELRPDGSARNSFPSRHSSWAYGIAGTAAYHLGPYSPWFVIGAHAIANGVGFQRVLAHRHWPGDVLAGAGIGIGTDLFTRAIGNWIFGYHTNFPCWSTYSNQLVPSLSMSTGAEFPLNKNFGEYVIGTSLASTVRGIVPFSENWGLCLGITLSSAPLKYMGKFADTLTDYALTAGANYSYDFGNSPFALSAFAEGGYKRNIQPKHISVSGGDFIAKTAIQCSVMLTKKLSLGTECGYSVSQLGIEGNRHSLSSLYASFLTRASF